MVELVERRVELGLSPLVPASWGVMDPASPVPAPVPAVGAGLSLSAASLAEAAQMPPSWTSETRDGHPPPSAAVADPTNTPPATAIVPVPVPVAVPVVSTLSIDMDMDMEKEKEKEREKERDTEHRGREASKVSVSGPVDGLLLASIRRLRWVLLYHAALSLHQQRLYAQAEVSCALFFVLCALCTVFVFADSNLSPHSHLEHKNTTTQHNNTTQHNTTQHNTTQHNTTQHNTTQHNALSARYCHPQKLLRQCFNPPHMSLCAPDQVSDRQTDTYITYITYIHTCSKSNPIQCNSNSNCNCNNPRYTTAMIH